MMSEINPRTNGEDAAAAANEESGYSFEGDTPPAEGAGVGDTNSESSADRPGDRNTGKLVIVVIAALVAVFIALAVIGRVVGFL